LAEVEAEPSARAVGRLTFFSDAVVAIAITLLAIDLPVPHGPTIRKFLDSAGSHGAHYLAFLISFAAIGAAWSHHHEIFQYAVKMDNRLRLFNQAWLLMIVLTPFATKLLTSDGPMSVRFAFYALLQALESLTMLVMMRRIVTQGHAPDLPKNLAAETSWQSAGLALGFALSVPIFFATSFAWLLWIVTPIASGQVYKFRFRQEPTADPG
jgi:TMEM175 potassium channel family protein